MNAFFRSYGRHALSPYTTVRNLIKLATGLPLMVRVCESNIIFLPVRPASVHLSVTLSPPKQNLTKLAT